MTAMARVTFYFDLGSPYAYLAAERLERVLPDESVKWQPVSLGALFKLANRGSWSLSDPERRRAGMAEVQRRAAAYGLPAIRWPDPWPGNYLMAMRAATYAAQAERGREFVRSAFRSAFQHGNDLSVPSHVLQAAADAGLDPRQTEAATQDAEIKLALRKATDAAHARGVFGVPTVAIVTGTETETGTGTEAGIGTDTETELFWGDDRLQEAAASLARHSPGNGRKLANRVDPATEGRL